MTWWRPSTWQRSTRLWAMTFLTFSFMVLELVVGSLSHCVALTTDAFHMLSDVASMLIAIFSVYYSGKDTSSVRLSYGYARSELLGSLINSVFLMALCFSVLVQSITKFIDMHHIDQPGLLLVTGTSGLVINIVAMFMFHESSDHHHHQHHSHSEQVVNDEINNKEQCTLVVQEDDGRRSSVVSEHINMGICAHSHVGGANIKAVFLHALGDALGSVIVIFVGALTYIFPDSKWVVVFDPLLSLAIVIIIYCATFPLFRRTAFAMMQATPPSINLSLISKALSSIDGVCAVNRLHVWELSEKSSVGTVTIHYNNNNNNKLPIITNTTDNNGRRSSCDDGNIFQYSQYDAILRQATFVFESYHIESTIQLEIWNSDVDQLGQNTTTTCSAGPSASKNRSYRLQPISINGNSCCHHQHNNNHNDNDCSSQQCEFKNDNDSNAGQDHDIIVSSDFSCHSLTS